MGEDRGKDATRFHRARQARGSLHRWSFQGLTSYPGTPTLASQRFSQAAERWASTQSNWHPVGLRHPGLGGLTEKTRVGPNHLSGTVKTRLPSFPSANSSRCQSVRLRSCPDTQQQFCLLLQFIPFAMLGAESFALRGRAGPSLLPTQDKSLEPLFLLYPEWKVYSYSFLCLFLKLYQM